MQVRRGAVREGGSEASVGEHGLRTGQFCRLGAAWKIVALLEQKATKRVNENSTGKFAMFRWPHEGIHHTKGATPCLGASLSRVIKK